MRPRVALLNNGELWAGLFWLGVGAFVVWAGRDLGTGTRGAPGSGFLPFWAGLLMCGFALAIVAAAVRDGGAPVGSLWQGTRWPRVLLFIGSLALYAMLLDLLGFLLATTPLLLILLRAVDPVRWRVAVPTAFVATIGTWWVLKRALLIQLPSGIFEIG
jgi:putative tricarboxylic transport membrane protein